MYFTRLRLRHYSQPQTQPKLKLKPKPSTNSNIKINKEDDSCLICLESSTTNNHICKMKILLLSYFYYKPCKCDGLFHHDCLLKWIYVSKSCPICRSVIETDTDHNEDDDDTKLPLSFNIIHISFNIFYLLLKGMLLFCLIKTTFDIVFSIENLIEQEQCIDENSNEVL